MISGYTSLSEQLLRACFGEEDEALRAREACSTIPADYPFESGDIRLLPMFYLRWSGAAATDDPFFEHCRLAYLTAWGGNQQRLACIAELVTELDKAGIESMLLKGAALLLNHYRDAGARNMDDFDLLIHPRDVEAAAQVLHEIGWSNQNDCQPRDIARLLRAQHAWHFYRGPIENCDLHGRPVPCCYSPSVAELFWQSAKTTAVNGHGVKVPCATDQLFHICLHGLRWHNPPKIHWVADALTVLRSPEAIDWDRMHRLACEGAMQDGLFEALHYLRSAWNAPIPQDCLDRLDGAQMKEWERREHRLLQNTQPQLLDIFRWHIYRFRRVRPLDESWRRMPALIGFPQYLAAAAGSARPGWTGLVRRFWSRLTKAN